MGIKRRTSTTKMVPVLSREAMQIHDRSPTQSKPQSHRVRLLASVAPHLHLNHFPSKNLELQIIRTRSSPARRASLGKHTSQCPDGCAFRERRWREHSEHTRCCGYARWYQQLLGLLGNRDKGSAQGPDPDRGSQLMLRGLAMS